jgi:A/G-specific adenine glycosylase
MAGKSPKLGHKKIGAFQAQIWAFYEHSGRKLSWRNTRNPYKILISEVMLQQTQVARVLEKYPEFLKKFPTLEALAASPLGDVLRAWQGMGYNRRARYLKDAAEAVIEGNGKIPKTETDLLKLPGIGHYTANAILAFAYNEPRVFIETNIRRVFIHHFFKNLKSVSDKQILPLVDQTLDISNPREWYYALMDYGAQLPKVTKRNSNTQSKHYTKQSTFKGSLRELRGTLIRKISEGPKKLKTLQTACKNDPRTAEALAALTKDKLIHYEKEKYKLA